mmetsp:Transcript_62830/g.168620  ORF Transcript_62830/g.168620 Transcript_62830/m.168620 type:complete len:242 (-) Transcript_62830:5-730(-)
MAVNAVAALYGTPLGPIAAPGGTRAPLPDRPLDQFPHGGPRLPHRLHARLRGRDTEDPAGGPTIRGLLAGHGALGVRAVLGPPAMPLALRLRTHGLAPHIHIPRALQSTLRLLTLRRTLRRLAIQGLLPLTRVIRAEHRAVGLPALHLAPLHPVPGRRGLGAPGLALGDGALGVAVLLADRLSAFPGAMGDAALAFFEGNDGGHGTVGYLQRPHGHRPRGQLHDAHPLHRVVPDAEVYDKV